MYVAYHMVNEEMSELDLWKELHKKIFFTPIDGQPEVAPSNNLYNRNPYAKLNGNIIIHIVDGDEILSQTTVEQVSFKPTNDQNIWELASGQSDKIVKTVTQDSDIANKLNIEEPFEIDVDSASKTIEWTPPPSSKNKKRHYALFWHKIYFRSQPQSFMITLWFG